MLREEALGGGVEAQPVLGPREAVPLVGEQDVLLTGMPFSRIAATICSLSRLLHPRVVRPLADQQRLA